MYWQGFPNIQSEGCLPFPSCNDRPLFWRGLQLFNAVQAVVVYRHIGHVTGCFAAAGHAYNTQRHPHRKQSFYGIERASFVFPSAGAGGNPWNSLRIPAVQHGRRKLLYRAHNLRKAACEPFPVEHMRPFPESGNAYFLFFRVSFPKKGLAVNASDCLAC